MCNIIHAQHHYAAHVPANVADEQAPREEEHDELYEVEARVDVAEDPLRVGGGGGGGEGGREELQKVKPTGGEEGRGELQKVKATGASIIISI